MRLTSGLRHTSRKRKPPPELPRPVRYEPSAIECESLPFPKLLSGRDLKRTVTHEWYPL